MGWLFAAWWMTRPAPDDELDGLGFVIACVVLPCLIVVGWPVFIWWAMRGGGRDRTDAVLVVLAAATATVLGAWLVGWWFIPAWSAAVSLVSLEVIYRMKNRAHRTPETGTDSRYTGHRFS